MDNEARMIKKIRIKNFKTHQNTALKLHPGLNAIIGLPDSGKSNIRQAIEWVATNRPRGFRFHSDFTEDKSTSVILDFDNGKVQLKKDKRNAFYKLNKEKPYRKFSTDIPDRIVEAVNLNPINFSDQFDLPFLVNSTPTEIARTINEYTKIDSINNCIQSLTKKINVLKTKYKVITPEIKKLTKKIKKYKLLKRTKRYITKANEINNQVEKNSNEIQEIINIKSSVFDIQKFLKHKAQLEEAQQYIHQAEVIRTKIERSYSKLNLLQSAMQLKEQIIIAKKEKKKRIAKFIGELEKQKVCPTCMSTITTKHIKEIEEELK